jgi:hypothetical protein
MLIDSGNEELGVWSHFKGKMSGMRTMSVAINVTGETLYERLRDHSAFFNSCSEARMAPVDSTVENRNFTSSSNWSIPNHTMNIRAEISKPLLARFAYNVNSLPKIRIKMESLPF